LIGIITNADKSVNALVDSLGISQFLTAVVTSEQAGVEKPDSAIFKAAYVQAGLKPEEMVYVGDQLTSDVMGANKAGSRGILLDRYNIAPEVNCPRITSLDQLPEYI
jgi:putative hydrolase of the HAD superfamily